MNVEHLLVQSVLKRIKLNVKQLLRKIANNLTAYQEVRIQDAIIPIMDVPLEIQIQTALMDVHLEIQKQGALMDAHLEILIQGALMDVHLEVPIQSAILTAMVPHKLH